MAKKGTEKKTGKADIAPVPATKDPVVIVQEKVKGMQQMLASTPITNDDELKVASDRISNVKKLLAYIKGEKDKLVKPAKAIIAEAGEKYDPFIKECQNAEVVLKERAKKYLDAKDAAASKEEARIAARVEKGTLRTDTAIEKMENIERPQTTTRTPDSGIKRSIRKVAVIEQPDLVPDEFWVIDEVRVRREALEREKSGLPQIPGVIIKEESTISSV